jgi:hypothetical protein
LGLDRVLAQRPSWINGQSGIEGSVSPSLQTIPLQRLPGQRHRIEQLSRDCPQLLLLWGYNAAEMQGKMVIKCQGHRTAGQEMGAVQVQ